MSRLLPRVLALAGFGLLLAGMIVFNLANQPWLARAFGVSLVRRVATSGPAKSKTRYPEPFRSHSGLTCADDAS